MPLTIDTENLDVHLGRKHEFEKNHIVVYTTEKELSEFLQLTTPEQVRNWAHERIQLVMWTSDPNISAFDVDIQATIDRNKAYALELEKALIEEGGGLASIDEVKKTLGIFEDKPNVEEWVVVIDINELEKGIK